MKSSNKIVHLVMMHEIFNSFASDISPTNFHYILAKSKISRCTAKYSKIIHHISSKYQTKGQLPYQNIHETLTRFDPILNLTIKKVWK